MARANSDPLNDAGEAVTSALHQSERAVVSPRVSRARMVRWVILSAVTTAAVIIYGTAGMISSLRHHVLADTKREVRNLAYTLAEESDRSIQALELVQRSLIDRMERRKFASPAQFRDVMSEYDGYVQLKDAAGGLPHVETFSIFDPHGKLINFSRAWPTPPLDVSDRVYVQKLLGDPTLISLLSEPLRNKSAGTWSMYLARKVYGPDGQLLGLVTGGLELNSFEEIFGALKLEKGVDIALRHDDGTLLAHYPPIPSAIGTKPQGAETGTRDGEQHIASERSLSRYPARLTVSAEAAPALAEWRREAVYLCGAAALVVLMIAFIAFVTIRQFGNYAQLLKARNDQAKAEAAQATAEAVMNERGRAQERLNRQKIQLDAAITNMPQGLAMYSADAQLVLCNDRYLEMYGLNRDVATPGRSLRDILAYQTQAGVLDADPDALAAKVLSVVRSGKGERTTIELPDGRSIDIANRPMDDGGWVSTHEDITERRRAHRQLQRTEKLLVSVIENVPTSIAVKDARDFRYLLINGAAEKHFGLPRSEVIGWTARDLFPTTTADVIESHDKELLASNHEIFFDEHMVETPKGERRLITARRLPLRDENGQTQYLLSLVDDITERKQTERRLAYVQQHDALTGLPNRFALARHLAEHLERARAERSSFAVLSLDLDRFKQFNDVFGQVVGDGMLREIAHRLQEAVEGAFLAHVGSDEFALVTADGPQPATAELFCERLSAAMADKFTIDSVSLRARLSIGVALYPTDGKDATALLSNADAALNRAKNEGRSTYRFFEANLDQSLRERRALQHDLLTAIERGEFALHYQPVAKNGGEVLGFEALLRWHHPTRGAVPPSEFIPLAEDSGQILAIGEWVLREACRAAASWPRPLGIAVNVSPLQFRQGDIVALVHSALLETGLTASRLTIEITESTLMVDFSHAVSMLRRLKLLGVNVAMDDFGTGYSSLSYLRSIPFDKIKIDQSFIINLGKDAQAGAIVRGVIDLIHSLGLTALAEGVETKEQLAALQEIGCEEVQGYLIGRPCPISFYGHIVGDAPDQPSGDNVLPLAPFAGIQARDRSSRARKP